MRFHGCTEYLSGGRGGGKGERERKNEKEREEGGVDRCGREVERKEGRLEIIMPLPLLLDLLLILPQLSAIKIHLVLLMVH